MPTIPSIRNSIENQSVLVLDEHARNGVFRKDDRGRVYSHAGGFSVVFPYETANHEKWAFRCWHGDLGSLRSHFEILSDELQRIGLPYFCQFAYVDEGIVVDGLKYPTTRMRWVDGLNIKQFIFEHKAEKQRLKRLATSFLTMVQTLHQHNIAHGDLQHGNILVDENDNLFLIDYDSVYLPALKGQADIITGLKGYQHPNRSKNANASEKLDYFSELIIYTSILAVAEKPALADKYKLEDSEQMLFAPEDFNDLLHSDISYDLSSLNGIFPHLLDILGQYLAEDDINNLQPFDVLMDKVYCAPQIHFFRLSSGTKVVVGKDAKVVWEVDNVSELYLNGEAIEVYQKKHTEQCSELGIRHFELLAINGLHQTQATLDIEVVQGAIITFTADRKNLKRGKHEQTVLRWNIENAKSAILLDDQSKQPIKMHGSKTVEPESTTAYRIVAEDDYGHITTEVLKVHVMGEAEVHFDADKLFTYATIPVKLTWEVKLAREVQLDGKKVEPCDSCIVDVSKETTFTLSVRDVFGTTKYPLVIRTIPLPLIKSFMVPAPEIEKSININFSILNPNINIQLKPLQLAEPAHIPLHIKENNPTIVPNGIVERLGTIWNRIKQFKQNKQYE